MRLRPTRLVLLSLILQTVGCVSNDGKAYPSEWPDLDEPAACSTVGGSYRNIATGTTRSGSSKVQSAPLAFLSHLLSDGTANTSAEFDASVEIVAIDTTKLTYFTDRVATRSIGESRGRWKCESDGTLTITFEEPAQGEGFVGTLHTRIILRKAADGSLIVGSYYRSRGAWLVVPGGHDAHDWFRFESSAARWSVSSFADVCFWP